MTNRLAVTADKDKVFFTAHSANVHAITGLDFNIRNMIADSNNFQMAPQYEIKSISFFREPNSVTSTKLHQLTDICTCLFVMALGLTVFVYLRPIFRFDFVSTKTHAIVYQLKHLILNDIHSKWKSRKRYLKPENVGSISLFVIKQCMCKVIHATARIMTK